MKTLASGLGLGILLAATIVRALLVPSLVSLSGSWSWRLPAGAAKVLRVAPSYPHPERDEPPHRLVVSDESSVSRRR